MKSKEEIKTRIKNIQYQRDNFKTPILSAELEIYTLRWVLDE